MALPAEVLAWGDEGHRVIALIATHFLMPPVRKRLDAILATDVDDLTAHDIVAAATWADRFRDSDRDTTRLRYAATQAWHFVNIDLSAQDIDAACFGRPMLAAATLASAGVARACVVDKIEQFAAELHSPATAPAERLLAAKFLLHLVGDLHQPLHAGNDADAGGNGKPVRVAGGVTPMLPCSLHHYWDVELVRQLGAPARRVAARLKATIGPKQLSAWSGGTPIDWARDTFAVTAAIGYGGLGAPVAGVYVLDAPYRQRALAATALQLQKGGVRLAAVLNRALADDSAVPRRDLAAPAISSLRR